MHLSSLYAQNLRLFKTLEIELAAGINVLVGQNGAGKTSVLEAIDILSRGKSFRTANLAEVTCHDQKELVISAEIETVDQPMRLGLAKNGTNTQLRVDGQNISRWSDLTKHLPLLTIHPESYSLVTGGPSERRKYLDWGLFHVEPQFQAAWRDYMKALKQRNYCLKQGQIDEAQQWHQPLSKNGDVINDLRIDYCQRISPIVRLFASKLGLNDSISFKYVKGWKEQIDLSDALKQELQTKGDLPLSTQVGPHRAEWMLTWEEGNFAKTSSRGQQKILAIALKLAQAKYLYIQNKKSSMYLIDELPAELDEIRCTKVLSLLSEINSQTLITSVAKAPLTQVSGQDAKWFHVEHGQVTTMV